MMTNQASCHVKRIGGKITALNQLTVSPVLLRNPSLLVLVRCSTPPAVTRSQGVIRAKGEEELPL